jgi:hypothetical protein
MVQYELEHRGRLDIFQLLYFGRLAVRASGYLLTEAGERRFYLVTFEQALSPPPRRFGHVALARLGKEMAVASFVPVDHGMPGVPGRVLPSALEGGFVRYLPSATLGQLEHKLALLAR